MVFKENRKYKWTIFRNQTHIYLDIIQNVLLADIAENKKIPG